MLYHLERNVKSVETSRNWWHVQLFSLWLSVAVCSAAYVSTRNFTCLREITSFLIGSRLVER